jgi:hypothetical protein
VAWHRGPRRMCWWAWAKTMTTKKKATRRVSVGSFAVGETVMHSSVRIHLPHRPARSDPHLPVTQSHLIRQWTHTKT